MSFKDEEKINEVEDKSQETTKYLDKKTKRQAIQETGQKAEKTQWEGLVYV